MKVYICLLYTSAIKELGYSTVTPIVITNSSQFLDVVETESKNIELEDNLITVLF